MLLVRKIWIQFNDQFHEISNYIFKLTTDSLFYPAPITLSSADAQFIGKNNQLTIVCPS